MNNWYRVSNETLAKCMQMPDELVKYCTAEATRMERSPWSPGTPWYEWFDSIVETEYLKAKTEGKLII